MHIAPAALGLGLYASIMLCTLACAVGAYGLISNRFRPFTAAKRRTSRYVLPAHMSRSAQWLLASICISGFIVATLVYATLREIDMRRAHEGWRVVSCDSDIP
jgi:hypothetical protein